MTKATAWYTTREVLARFLILLACTMAVYGVKKHKELKAGVTTITTTVVETKTQYIEKPLEGLHTMGPVTVTEVWESTVNNSENGQYQFEDMDGVITTVKFCYDPVPPVFKRGWKVIVDYTIDKNQGCFKMSKAKAVSK